MHVPKSGLVAFLALTTGVGALAWGGWGRSRPAPPQAAAIVTGAVPEAVAPRQNSSDRWSVPANTRVNNRHAYIPPQCYAETRDPGGGVHNPCMSCHVDGRRPNFVSDGDLQVLVSLPVPAQSNPWSNLFADRGSSRTRWSQSDMLAYVRSSNYRSADGDNLLARDNAASVARGNPARYVPDAYFSFDDEGFDHAPDGTPSGWRAYSYYPLPGMFLPTNGSFGDALIRLPEMFRTTESGQRSQAVYRTNLAILESLIKNQDVAIPNTDEAALGVDLDRDGKLASATVVRFEWAPLHGKTMQYVGAARLAQQNGNLKVAAGLFPEGTEFLHTLRYFDVAGDRVTPAARMKELRYARKTSYLNYSRLSQIAADEVKEDHDFPDRLHTIRWSPELGASTPIGWRYGGFIEDESGALRPQTREETTSCVGCHSGVGATADGTFSFARKLSGSELRFGWFHPSQQSLAGVPEPKRADGRFEYSTYLERVGGGDDFRANAEVRVRFFDQDGRARQAAFNALHDDVDVLLLPSKERALSLNAAYRALVSEQSFTLGRDAVLAPVQHVLRSIDEDTATGTSVPEPPPWAVPKGEPRRNARL